MSYWRDNSWWGDPAWNAFKSAQFFAPLNDIGSGAVNLTLNNGAGLATFTRATSATTFNSNGTLVTVASGVARSKYDPVSLAYLGYLSENAATNVALYCRDFTNAAWVKTSITAALTATGIDGVANSASTLTASAANGTVLQSVALASSTRAQSVWVRRRTGTGAISMTTDGGTTYTDITSQIGAAFSLVQITQAAVTNPSFGFKIATSGDAIDVDYCQNEAGTFATSPILTTSAAVTRNADILQYPITGNILATAGAIYSESIVQSIGNSAGIAVGGTSNNWQLNRFQSASVFNAFDGTNNPTLGTGPYSSGAFYKAAQTWGGTFFYGAVNGSAVGSGSFGGTLFTSDTLLTVCGNGGVSSNMILRNLRIWQSQLSKATLQAITQ